ncbi:MAG: hypothetical protein ACR2NI_05060, partial [Pirellulales bacterium]
MDTNIRPLFFAGIVLQSNAPLDELVVVILQEPPLNDRINKFLGPPERTVRVPQPLPDSQHPFDHEAHRLCHRL